MPDGDSRVNLLWTGGWDSTFRLLDLVLVKRRPVRPYYLVVPRGSTNIEIETMRKIRGEIAKVDEASAALVGELIQTPVEDVAPIPCVSERFQRLLSRRHLGSQYEMLARFATSHGLEDLELSIHRDDIAHAFLESEVCRESDWYRLIDDPRDDDLRLFERFRFPLFDLTKVEMERYAEARGFAEIMELTWFCHRPRRGVPCGTCMPCRFAMVEGMGRRIPFANRLRYYADSAKRRAKQIIRRWR